MIGQFCIKTESEKIVLFKLDKAKIPNPAAAFGRRRAGIRGAAPGRRRRGRG
jgi:hypothetical protein